MDRADRDEVDEEIDRFLDGVNIARMEIDREDVRPAHNVAGAIPPAPGHAANVAAINNINREQPGLAGANMLNNLPNQPEVGVHLANAAALHGAPVGAGNQQAGAALMNPQVALGGAQVAGGGGEHQGGAARLPAAAVQFQPVPAAAGVQVAQLLPVHQYNGQGLGAAGNAPQVDVAMNEALAPNAIAANNNGRFHPYRGKRAGQQVKAQQMSQNILRVIGDIGHITYGQKKRGRGRQGRNRGETRGGNHGGNAGGNQVGNEGPR